MKKRLSQMPKAFSWLLSALMLLFLMSPLAIQASRGKIVGQVLESDGNPAAGAAVKLSLNGQVVSGQMADVDGNFTFDNIWPGVYELEANLLGSSVKKQGISVNVGQTVEVRLRLPAQTVELEQLMISNTTSQDRSPRGKDAIKSGSHKRMEATEYKYSVTTMSAERSLNRTGYVYPAPVTDPQSGTEGYDFVSENEFIQTTDNPTSTFSIDVDAASYSNTRRFLLQEKRMPPEAAVRVEEFINYFDYDYPQPSGGRPFSITTEISECPWNTQHKIVHVGLQGRTVENHNLPPSNIVFLLDVSGSMNSANKLGLVKQGMKMLVQQLRPQDKVAIVVYAGAAGEVLPATSGANKQAIMEALDRLQAGGSTAGGAGIELAYKIAQKNKQAQGNNRVILCTDGDFNVGISGEEALVKLIEEKRKTGIFLTVLGFGTGNLQDSKMEKLADNGNGNYAYIDGEKEAQKVFVNETGGTLLTIAKDVKLQLSFHPEKVKAYRLIGYENRKLKNEDFDNDKKDAGELGAGHTVTALYEVIPAGNQAETRASASSGQSQPKPSKSTPGDGELLTVRLRYKPPHADKSELIEVSLADRQIALASSSANFRFSAAVAGFGMLLRKSKHCGTLRYDEVLALAKGAMGKDPHGYRAEFLTLVEAAKRLDSNPAAGK